MISGRMQFVDSMIGSCVSGRMTAWLWNLPIAGNLAERSVVDSEIHRVVWSLSLHSQEMRPTGTPLIGHIQSGRILSTESEQTETQQWAYRRLGDDTIMQAFLPVDLPSWGSTWRRGWSQAPDTAVHLASQHEQADTSESGPRPRWDQAPCNNTGRQGRLLGGSRSGHLAYRGDEPLTIGTFQRACDSTAGVDRTAIFPMTPILHAILRAISRNRAFR